MKHSQFILIKLLPVLFIFSMLFSCISRKEIAYFQDLDNLNVEITYIDNDVVKINDLLEIDVLNEDMAATKPFNYYAFNDNDSKDGLSNSKPKYLVNRDGTINFPQLGKLHIAGKSLTQVEDFIENKLKTFIKEPLVHVKLLNFKISILGEVNAPGTYEIPEGRINILQALGKAGDLKLTGKRENVLLIRDVNGVQATYRIDLTKSDLFNSEYYYLQQNDVIIVEPNKSEITNAGNSRQLTQLILSSVSILLTVFIFIETRSN